MKNLLLGVAILLSCYAAHAQTLTVNNNQVGDVYLKVYAVVPGSCGTVIDYVDVMVPAYTTGVSVNLAVPGNWAGGAVPTVTYELCWAYVSRDASCPGSPGWGSWAGSCGGSTNMYYDEVFVGDATCGFSAQDCLLTIFTPTSCGGFAAGDVVTVQYNVAGTNVTIDVL